MSHLLIDLDASGELPRIELGREHNGVGIIVRWKGRPIDFVLHRAPRGTVLASDDVGRLLGGARDAARRGAEASVPRPCRTPSLTAVVCTHDRPQKLERCLASLQALASSSAAAHTQLQLLVVDNAPSDERTREIVQRAPTARYVRARPQGLDFARNCALREAETEFVAYFDDDVTVDPGWLDGFAEALAEHPDAAAVTGPVLPYELATPSQVLFEQYGGFGHRFRKMRYGRSLPGDRFHPCRPGRIGAGCNMAVSRSFALQLGGFDEALDTGATLPGGGDLDMIYRILRAGRPIVTEPRCLVFHEHRRSYEELRRQMFTWGLGFMAFVSKSYRADPEQRAKFRRLVVQWFAKHAWQLVRSSSGPNGWPLELSAAQLAGGVVGLLGEYSRSQRRVRRLVSELLEGPAEVGMLSRRQGEPARTT